MLYWFNGTNLLNNKSIWNYDQKGLSKQVINNFKVNVGFKCWLLACPYNPCSSNYIYPTSNTNIYITFEDFDPLFAHTFALFASLNVHNTKIWVAKLNYWFILPTDPANHLRINPISHGLFCTGFFMGGGVPVPYLKIVNFVCNLIKRSQLIVSYSNSRFQY